MSTTKSLHTPWGAAQTVEDIGRGILAISTAGHGGYFVPETANALIPREWRMRTFNNGQGMLGWYEEDCDWCYVALTFPELFPAGAQEPAAKTFAWLKDRRAAA